MKRIIQIGSVALAGLSSTVTAARPIHHERHLKPVHKSQEERRSKASKTQSNDNDTGFNPYAGYGGPGSAVLNATIRAAHEPGVTLELAPDAKETATGGPVGGPPGFDGS